MARVAINQVTTATIRKDQTIKKRKRKLAVRKSENVAVPVMVAMVVQNF